MNKPAVGIGAVVAVLAGVVVYGRARPDFDATRLPRRIWVASECPDCSDRCDHVFATEPGGAPAGRYCYHAEKPGELGVHDQPDGLDDFLGRVRLRGAPGLARYVETREATLHDGVLWDLYVLDD